jgi:hypothetical protein
VRTPRDVPFDSLEIVLLGIARTSTDVVQFRRQASRVFLRMQMPVDAAASYPVPRVFEAGTTHEFAFSFVVPSQLTISSCEHPVKGDHVRAEHLSLPPTMGFWKSPAAGAKDDMAPEMSQIEYLVKATILAQPDLGAKPERIMAGVHPINVLPASAEAPPLDLSGPAEKVYTTTKTKSIRKGLLSSKTGRLTASATQPGAIFLSSDGRSASSSVAAVNLSFAPSSSSSPSSYSAAGAPPAPPAIHSVTAKITATTHFNSTSLSELPNMRVLGPEDFATSDVTMYSTSTTLFSAGFEKVPWQQQQQQQAPISRRDSGYETEDKKPSSSSSKKSSNKSSKSPTKRPATVHNQHTAALLIPFTLPTDKKLFLPTFHSCLISRTYTLHLSISAGPTSTALNLALPLQVAVQDYYNNAGAAGDTTTAAAAAAAAAALLLPPTFEAVLEEREADEYMRPRIMGRAAMVPVDDDDAGSCPPGYAAATATRRPPAVVA